MHLSIVSVATAAGFLGASIFSGIGSGQVLGHKSLNQDLRSTSTISLVDSPKANGGSNSSNSEPKPAQAPEPEPESSTNNAKNKDKKDKLITVKSGDYLNKLARVNDTTGLRLFYANKTVKNPNLIYPKQKLRVPTKKEQLTPRTVPKTAPIVKSNYVPKNYTTNPVPKQKSQPKPAATKPSNGVWDKIAACESGGNWSINTGNGFYGGLQFTLSSWHGVGGSGKPNQASKSEQIARAELLQARQGWGAWPACTAKLGLR